MDFNNISGTYQKALKENRTEFISYSVNNVEYSQDSAELVKEKEKSKHKFTYFY